MGMAPLLHLNLHLGNLKTIVQMVSEGKLAIALLGKTKLA